MLREAVSRGKTCTPREMMDSGICKQKTGTVKYKKVRSEELAIISISGVESVRVFFSKKLIFLFSKNTLTVQK